MFADLGHFTVKSMQVAFTFLVFPSLLCAYIGQASFLMKNQLDDDVAYTFYRSVPSTHFDWFFNLIPQSDVINRVI